MKVLLALLLFIVFPCCGIQALLDGEIGLAMFFFLPLTFALCVLAYHELYEKPNEKRQEAIHKMYNLPQSVSGEYGEWEKKFQLVIAKAIESTSDTKKRSVLQRCQSVVKEMNKSIRVYVANDTAFQRINEAFQLTGCHLTITDSKGKTITKIV